MDQLQKVKVVARIRQSNISETYSSAAQQATNSSNTQVSATVVGTTRNLGDNTSVAPTQVGSPKSILVNAVQNMAANSSLDKDGKVCIFTASSSKEKPIYVAASGNPIKKQLLTEYVKTDKNIVQYRHSILENANIFKFDHAMSYKITNEQLYQYQCQELVQKAMSQGVSSTFIVVGPAKAGKKFTIKGGEQTEKGILTRAVDDMIRLSDLQSQSSGTKVTQRNKPVQVVFSIFAIYNNEIIDLLQKDPNEDELNEEDLTFSGEFRKFYMKSRERLKQIGSGDQAIRRLHIVYKFSVYRNETGKSKRRFNEPTGGLFSTVTFVHCADFCKAKMPEFVVLGDYLTDIATRKDANIMEVPAYQNSQLITYINDSLNSGKDNACVLLCNISGSYDYLSSSVDCLQYCGGIKERIDHYFEDVNAFNSDHEVINQLTSGNKSLPDLQQAASLSRRGNSGYEAGGTFRNQGGSNHQQEGGELIHIPQRDATYQFRRLRGENPNQGEIQQDLSNLMKDIYTFTDQTHGLSEEEIRDWAHDREAELQSIQNDISKLSPQEQKQFEAAQYKIQESLNFLQQIKKNAAQLAQNRSPTSGGMRQSDDLGTLMSQYNKNKESLRGPGSQDELVKSMNYSEQQEGNQSYTYQNNIQGAGGKRNMQELREQILNKIEEVINENDASRRSVRMGGRNGESGDFNGEKSSRNLKQLKELLADQDFLMQEKRQKLKQKNKELKEQQVELRNQLQFLENDVKEKDARVQYLEDQKEGMKEQIERDRDIIQLKIDKEELLEKNDEELRELIDRLKLKLQRRKEECLLLKDNIDKVERDIYSERIHFQDEKNSLVRQVNELMSAYEDEKLRNEDVQRINDNLDYQIENQERLIKKFQEDLDLANKRYESVQLMFQEEQNINKELKINQAVQEKRIEESEDRAQVLEVKLNKLKKRFQEERNLLAEEKDQELIKKKETTARLKNEIKEFERRVQELTQESKILRAENQKLEGFNDEIKREAQQKSRQVVDISEEMTNLQQELKRIRNVQRESASLSSNDQYERKKLIEENDRLNISLRKADTTLRTMEKELEERNFYIDNLKKDMIHIDSENYGQKDFINKLERQNQYLSDVQHTDMDRLDHKVKQLNQEVNQLRKENKELKQRDNDQQLNLSDFRGVIDKQNDKLNKNKNVIKHLTTQLDQMDDKVKELIHDKNLEISQVHHSQISHSNHPHNLSRTQMNESLSKSAQTNYRNAPNQQRSILKKPRFNLADSDSDDSDDLDV